jgi:hypothetical protein
LNGDAGSFGFVIIGLRVGLVDWAAE